MRYFSILALCLFACAGEDPEETGTEETGTEVEDIAVAGAWVDNFGSNHIISNTSWDSFDAETPVALTAYDNTGMWAVGQNAPDDAYNPDLWSRFDWHWDDAGQLWYCQTAFGAESEQAALDTAPADATDVANSGCSGFSWSSLTAAE